MNYDHYLEKFQKAAGRVDKTLLAQKSLELSTGIVLQSVYLKLYKKEWTNSPSAPLQASSRIFFSIWVNEKTINENKIFYNIHALKLRKLNGYAIASKAFAAHFRTGFEPYRQDWENVSVHFGPLTLMEGWEKLSEPDLEETVTRLASGFLTIDHLVDEALFSFKKQ